MIETMMIHNPPLNCERATVAVMEFAQPFANMLDTRERHIPFSVIDCTSTPDSARCLVRAYIPAENRSVIGILRVRRQSDGLLGFVLPFDPIENGVKL